MVTRSQLHAALAAATGSTEPSRVPEEFRSAVTRLGEAPPDLGPLRARVVLGWDEEATLWDCVDVVSGERALALVAPAGRLETVEARSPHRAVPGDGGTRHARYAPFGCLLSDLLPMEPDAIFAAEIAAAVLRAAPLRPATLAPELLVLGEHGWTLAWTGDSGNADGRALLDTLDPDGILADAASNPAAYSRALATILAGERHALAARMRSLGRRDHRSRLSPLARRLAETLAPPASNGLVGDLRVSSDGNAIWLGTNGLVWSRESGLDPRLARAILIRATVDADPALAPLLRWLAASSRLRVDLALLAHASTA